MISEFAKPPLDIVESFLLCYIIDKECSYSTPVVRTGYGTVPLLTSSVPNLCLDRLPLYLFIPSSYALSNIEQINQNLRGKKFLFD